VIGVLAVGNGNRQSPDSTTRDVLLELAQHL